MRSRHAHARSNGRAGTPLVLTDEDAKSRAAGCRAQARTQRADRRQSRGAAVTAATDRPGRTATSAATTISGSIPDRATRRSTDASAPRCSSIRRMAASRRSPTGQGAKQRLTRHVRPTSDQATREDDPGFEGADAYDDPEQRPLGERCIVGFGSTSGPPILPTYFYNNLHQIVQTPDTVLILTEMVHDARIVRMRRAASAERRSASGWATRSAAGKATRWSSIRPTSRDKTRFRGSTRRPARRRAVHAAWTRRRCAISSRWRIRTTWTKPWTAGILWPATNDLDDAIRVPARVTTRWATSCAARA